jgi:hypothetical protein
MRKTLTDRSVKALKPRKARFTISDPALAGHYVRVHPTGVKSYIALTRDPFGKQVWATIGNADVLNVGLDKVPRVK